MNKHVSLLIVLLLCASILCGCSEKTTSVSHTYQDLSLTIPSDFIDLSSEEVAEGLDFIFGRDPIAINGLREEKAAFEAYGLELTLEDYATLIILSNGVSVTPEEKDGYLTFTYEKVSNGVNYTYVVTLWETAGAFWTVQAYCATKNYQTAKTEIWEILNSVKI